MSTLDQLEALLKARPGQYVSALTIAKLAGLLSSRTRLSELRRWRGMTIENKLVKRRKVNGKPVTLSFYRWVP